MLSETPPKGLNTEYRDGISSIQSILSMDLSYEEFSDESATTNNRKRKYCPSCSGLGKPVSLRLRQINDNEAVYLCNQDECFFPLLEKDPQNYVVLRSFEELVASYGRKMRRLNSDSGILRSPEYSANQLSSPSRISNLRRRTTLPNESPKSSNLNEFIDEVPLKTNQSSIVPPTPSKVKDNIEPMAISSDSIDDSFTNLDISDPVESNSANIQNNAVTENLISTNLIAPDVKESYNKAALSLIATDHPPYQPKSDRKLRADKTKPSSAKNIAVHDKIKDRSNDIYVKAEEPVETICIPDGESSKKNALLIKEIKHGILPTTNTSTSLLQWPNKNNSCWLDVILMCLTTSSNIRKALNQNLSCEKDEEGNIIHGLCQVFDHCLTEHLEERDDSYEHTILCDSRNFILQLLNERFKIKSGDHESALEMFPNILKLQPFIKSLFTLQLRWEFECDECEHKQTRKSTKELVSFPSTAPQFHPLNATFHRSCFKCAASDQTMTMVMEKVPPCLLIHFKCGLPHNNLKVLSFGIQGVLYSVSAVIQYIKKPFNHFVVWVRNSKTNSWACCDGLKSGRCKWAKKYPKIPADQVHIVMWEKQTGDLESVTNDDAFGSSYESGMSDEDQKYEDVVDLETSNPDPPSAPRVEEETFPQEGVNSAKESSSEIIEDDDHCLNHAGVIASKPSAAVNHNKDEYADNLNNHAYYTRSRSVNASDTTKENESKVPKEITSKVIQTKLSINDLTNHEDATKQDSLSSSEKQQDTVDAINRSDQPVIGATAKTSEPVAEPITEPHGQVIEVENQNSIEDKPTADKPSQKIDTTTKPTPAESSSVKECKNNDVTRESMGNPEHAVAKKPALEVDKNDATPCPKNIRDSIEELFQEQDDLNSSIDVDPGSSTFFERPVSVLSNRSTPDLKPGRSMSPEETLALLKSHNIDIEELTIPKTPSTHPKFISDGLAIAYPSSNHFSPRPLVFIHKPVPTKPPPTTSIDKVPTPARFLSKSKPDDPEPSVLWNPMQNNMTFKTSLASADPLRMQFVNKVESQFDSYKPKRKFKLVGYKKASQKNVEVKQTPYKTGARKSDKENSVKPSRAFLPVNSSDKNSEYSDDISADLDRFSACSDGSVTTGSVGSVKSDPSVYGEYSVDHKHQYAPFLTPTGSIAGSPKNPISSDMFSGKSIDDMVDNLDQVLNDDTLFEDNVHSQSSFLDNMDVDPLSFLGI